MLWCRYLKSRPAIVASNFWASKYFGADSFSKFGILGFVLQKYRSASSYLMFFQDFLSLLVPRLDLLSLLDLCLGSVLLLSMWLFAYDCIIAAFYLSSTWFVTPQTVQDHKTCPSTNSRATICQCQWDATIHGYLGSLFAEQLFPSKKIWNIKWKWTNNWKFGVIMWSNQKFCRGEYFDKNMDKPSCKR